MQTVTIRLLYLLHYRFESRVHFVDIIEISTKYFKHFKLIQQEVKHARHFRRPFSIDDLLEDNCANWSKSYRTIRPRQLTTRSASCPKRKHAKHKPSLHFEIDQNANLKLDMNISNEYREFEFAHAHASKFLRLQASAFKENRNWRRKTIFVHKKI